MVVHSRKRYFSFGTYIFNYISRYFLRASLLSMVISSGKVDVRFGEYRGLRKIRRRLCGRVVIVEVKFLLF